MKSKLSIYVCEEYGYRYWLWKPDRSLTEVKKLWSELTSVPFFSPRSLPGTWTELKSNPHYGPWTTAPFIHAHIHWSDDSYLYIPDEGYVYHAGYNGTRAA